MRSVHREPRWDTAHIEHAREALTNFVDNIVNHINDANPRRLNRIRQGAIGAAFMALCSQAEIKTGDDFSVQLGASLTDPIAIEITVPAPWAIGALTESMDAIAAITSVDSLTEIAALPFDVVAPWEAVEDPAAAVEHPAEDPAPRRTFDPFDPFDDPFEL